MKVKPIFLSLLLLLTVLSFLQASSSLAVPAFARREKAKCQMCHYRLPELNEDGHAYIRRGLREERGGMAMSPGMVMGTAKTDDGPLAATDRALGEPLPLAWQDYLSLMGHHTYVAREHEKAAFHPGMIDGWIGGPLDRHWSGAVNFEVDFETGGVEVEQAYAQFITAWQPRFGSVRVGQLLPFAILFNGGGAQMPLSRPVVLKQPTRAQNPWVPKTLMRGIEVGVVDLSRWNAYVGVGQPQFEGMGVSHTDVYASMEVVGGEKGNALSLFGYKGELAAFAGQPSLDFTRVAVFANAYGARTKGVLGFLWGTDETDGEAALGTKGGFLLGEVQLAERWAGYARYDYASRDAVEGDAEITDGPTVGISFWAQTQVRLTLESQFLKAAEGPRERSAIAELMWAF